ncbi:PREDICTED: uncharacterized protein LOC108618979 isoform X4 [Drosophila arizonae]|uniref:Uncharacterized protein LOC108618979 isoform X4 n=1 Tax=Drosophila arizonae TaxID=7263 RepID=A0ABM1PU43_DROAR|nr:PREDICTED: uncharacterized protein LOC108618979 isoform X4 [Drosophila arizonae]
MSSTSSSVLALSSFNLLFFTQVLTVLSITIKYNEYATDKGGNISIPCIAQGNIMWVKEHGSNSTIIQTGRILVLRNVSTSDSGIYVCFATVPLTTTTSTTTTTTTARPTTARGLTMPATAAEATTSAPQQEQELEKEKERELEPTQPVEVEEEQEYRAYQRSKLTVRTTPGPVTQLYFKASTILGFLIWRFNKTQSGGYPVRSFTAEYRNISYRQPPYNASFEHAWSRMDPINIAPNVRQMEVYRLAPNTTYEFRIWANNELGSGTVVTTNVTTLPETKEEVNPTDPRACRHSRAPSSLATMDSPTTMMMMTTRRRRIRSRPWKSLSVKFRYSLQVPPSNVFESTKCNLLATPVQIYPGCF